MSNNSTKSVPIRLYLLYIYSLGAQNALKSQKSRGKVWRYRNFAYLCTRNPKEWDSRHREGFLEGLSETGCESSWKKSCKKVWKFQKYSLPLHPQFWRSWRMSLCRMVLKVLQEFLKKKVAKKFGSFKNTPYLCSPIRSQKKWRTNTEQGSLTYWYNWEKNVVFINSFSKEDFK